jgi:hypothetical protein
VLIVNTCLSSGKGTEYREALDHGRQGERALAEGRLDSAPLVLRQPDCSYRREIQVRNVLGGLLTSSIGRFGLIAAGGYALPRAAPAMAQAIEATSGR